jgi:hypothetical protein
MKTRKPATVAAKVKVAAAASPHSTIITYAITS